MWGHRLLPKKCNQTEIGATAIVNSGSKLSEIYSEIVPDTFGRRAHSGHQAGVGSSRESALIDVDEASVLLSAGFDRSF